MWVESKDQRSGKRILVNVQMAAAIKPAQDRVDVVLADGRELCVYEGKDVKQVLDKLAPSCENFSKEDKSKGRNR